MEYKISNSNKQVSFRFGNEDDPKTVLNMIKFVTQQFDDEEEDPQPHKEGLAAKMQGLKPLNTPHTLIIHCPKCNAKWEGTIYEQDWTFRHKMIACEQCHIDLAIDDSRLATDHKLYAEKLYGGAAND